MIKTVIIMRGFHGSGKSTYIKKRFVNQPVICSADHFFLSNSGEYKFSPEKLEEAHNSCMRKFVKAVSSSRETIVVDNTNISINEILPYYRVAKAFGYKIEIVECYCSLKTAMDRNIHNVPEDTYNKMITRWKGLPYWLLNTVLFSKEYTGSH